MKRAAFPLRPAAGLTLIEVVVAVFVLSVGVLAAAALQSSALQSNRQASRMQQLTQLAERALEHQQRALRSSLALPAASHDCSHGDHDAYRCTLETTPCQLLQGALQCSADVPAQLTKAFKLSVNVSGPQASTLTVHTVVRR